MIVHSKPILCCVLRSLDCRKDATGVFLEDLNQGSEASLHCFTTAEKWVLLFFNHRSLGDNMIVRGALRLTTLPILNRKAVMSASAFALPHHHAPHAEGGEMTVGERCCCCCCCCCCLLLLLLLLLQMAVMLLSTPRC